MKHLVVSTALVCWTISAAAQTRVDVLRNGDLARWDEENFKGSTHYATTTDNGAQVVKATASASASGRYRKIEVDLNKTPFLNWSWRVGQTFGTNDERSKPGDDYPARIYVVVSGGLLFWKTRAINYVWSSNQPVDTAWPNAYTANARMLAVHSGPGDVGRWVSERRNVRDDLRRLFGEDISAIDAVALMTDTDNTGGSATAYYGDIWFSAQ